MIHGPCRPQNKNPPCMDKSKEYCTKHFPKSFNDATHYTTSSYPIYR